MTRAATIVAWLSLLALTACADQPEPPGGDVPGFFRGLLHGALLFLSLVGSVLFDIRVYAFPNSGFWYDVGFVIGVLCWGAPYGHRVWSGSSDDGYPSDEGEAGPVSPRRGGPMTGGRAASAKRSVDADSS